MKIESGDKNPFLAGNHELIAEYRFVDPYCSLKDGEWNCCKEYKPQTTEQRLEQLENQMEILVKARLETLKSPPKRDVFGPPLNQSKGHTHWWK